MYYLPYYIYSTMNSIHTVNNQNSSRSSLQNDYNNTETVYKNN